MTNFTTVDSPAAAAVALLAASDGGDHRASAHFDDAVGQLRAGLEGLEAPRVRGIIRQLAAEAGVAPPQAQDPAEDEAEEDPAPAGDEAFIPSDDDAPGGLAAFAPAPALHRRKSSIGLGGLEASISDVLSKGRPAIVAEVERFVAEVDGNGDRRLYAEELVEALYEFFETSTISLAGLDVGAILKNQDPALVEDVRRCIQGMDADGDGRLTGPELVLKQFEVFAGYKAVAEDRARIAAESDVVRTDLSEAVKKLSWWKRVGAGSAVFGSAAFAVLFGSNLMANEVSKDTVVEDNSNFLLSKHGGAVKIQTASAELKPMVPRGEQPPQECRRLSRMLTSPCDSIKLPKKARRHLAASNPFDEVGFRALQDVGYFDDSAVAAIEGAMGGSIHVKTEDGAESILVKSISHDGDNLVLNGGEAFLVPTHECGYDDEARRLEEVDETRLIQAYTFCLEGSKTKSQNGRAQGP